MSKKFIEEVKKEQKRLRDKNRDLKIKGDRWRYTCNCNRLAGIDFMMGKLKKHGYI